MPPGGVAVRPEAAELTATGELAEVAISSPAVELAEAAAAATPYKEAVGS